MLLSDIARYIGWNKKIKSDRQIGWLLTDSRSLTFPSDTLFFALVSKRNDGHSYIQELYGQGVRAFVISTYIPTYDQMCDADFIQVTDTLEMLQQVAISYRNQFNIPVVGITGSNGKTIVKEWLFQLLHIDFNLVRSPRSYNSQIGVPLSVWQLKSETNLAVFEAGISVPGEMKRLSQIINPTIGIFTMIGDAHQENFKNPEQKIKEKLQLFSQSKFLIYSSDHLIVDHLIHQSGLQLNLLDWGKSSQAFVQLCDIRKKADGTYLTIRAKKVQYTVFIPFTDDASVENVMHCITLMHHFHYTPEVITKRVAFLEPVAMRLEVKPGIQNCLIINDSYNSDLNSLSIALDFLIQQSASKKLAKTLVLSDILQSGYSKQELYKKVYSLIRAKEIDKIIGVGTEISRFAGIFTDIECYFFQTTEDFLYSELLISLQHEVVLLKGSRRFRFELISQRLELVAHETILEVNLNALVENLNYFRSKLSPQTKVMCMVKAFAYGSGSVEIAKTLQYHRVDYVAVAVVDEGVELRRSGIRIPIVVMNPEKNALSLLFEYNLEPEIYGFNLLHEFVRAARKLGLNNYPVHIKMDSGMHRLGFNPEDCNRLIGELQSQHELKVRSVFTHLAAADNPSLDDFTHHQVQLFMQFFDKISASFPHRIIKHILNSAGIERFPVYQFDMVRLGIGHYGISALTDVQLKQVCTLKTSILQIKEVKAGETIGYNRNGEIFQDKRIAVLPIGYADGFDRKLGNGVGVVFVKGKRVRVIGNVSMDLITVDVSGLSVEEGDVVEVFGENITISELADTLQTIPYEILTGISRRVKRIYFQE